MAAKKARKAWSVEQRLEFIDFRLFWEGTIRRGDICEKFGVSIQQASIDLAKYRESAPENIVYDTSKKRYFAAARIKPVFYTPNPHRYLAQLRAIREDVIAPDDTMMGDMPECDVLPIPARDVSAHKLKLFLMAIRGGNSMSIEYQSMNETRPEPTWRSITPHALGSDGLRWHARAFCHLEERFKDFIISRCLRVGKLDAPHPEAKDDHDWNAFFDVILIPNPNFGEAQKRTIELDYGMKNGSCKVRVRHALLYYFNKRMRLDVSETHDRPKETPVVVENRAAYEKALAIRAT